jgi:hypothetical protein
MTETSVNIAMVDDRVDTTNDGVKNTSDHQVIFTDNAAAANYASATYDGVYTTGICETCHVATDWFESDGAPGGPGGPGSSPSLAPHAAGKCTTCHMHNPDVTMASVDGFMARGGTNIDQFFDALDTTPTGYNDVSRHVITRAAGLTYSGQPNCLYCHYTNQASTLQSNECLKCHIDNNVNQASIAGGGSHMDKIIQLANPTTGDNTTTPPNTVALSVSMASPDQRQTALYQSFCLGCHNASPNKTLGGLTPANISTAYETYGHGADASLSGGRHSPGGNYDCRQCHLSTVPTATGDILRDFMPGFHASINHWLVANTTSPYQTPEYPAGGTVDLRAASKDTWCLTKCHAPSANIIKHTWDEQGGQIPLKTGCPQLGAPWDDCQTHPSNVPLPATAHYKTAALLTFPLSEYSNPALPLPGAGNTGNVICVSCHTPHAHPNSASWTDVDKQMMRASITAATNICLYCHQ